MMEQPSFLILSLILTLSLSFTIKPSQADSAQGNVFVYWGQNSNDGTLNATCDTGNYDTVILAFLDVFGGDRPIQLNFTSHCVNEDCYFLEPDIKHCQQKGVKVFLSLGGPYGNYSLSSSEDAYEMAKFLYAFILSGENNGPLGNVALDGIDFYIAAGSNSYWDVLAKDLDNFRKQSGKAFYLSASPQCSYPDYYLSSAIGTGLFDHIFIRFYTNTLCQYLDSNPSPFYFAWYLSYVTIPGNGSVFLGLPASPAASPIDAYMSPVTLTSYVLPNIKTSSPKFGGVVIWNRGYDLDTYYAAQIKHYVSNSCTSIWFCGGDHNSFQRNNIFTT